MRNVATLARRYAEATKGRAGWKPAPAPTTGSYPGTTSPTGNMRFNPNVQLDPSQIEDRRRSIENLPIDPGGRASPGGDMPADRYGMVAQAFAPQAPQPGTDLQGLLEIFSRMLAQSQPRRFNKLPRRG